MSSPGGKIFTQELVQKKKMSSPFCSFFPYWQGFYGSCSKEKRPWMQLNPYLTCGYPIWNSCCEACTKLKIVTNYSTGRRSWRLKINFQVSGLQWNITASEAPSRLLGDAAALPRSAQAITLNYVGTRSSIWRWRDTWTLQRNIIVFITGWDEENDKSRHVAQPVHWRVVYFF